MDKKNNSLSRRSSIKAGICVLASSFLFFGSRNVEPVKAADGGNMIIGNPNSGTSQTSLTSGATHNFIGFNTGSGTGLTGHSGSGTGTHGESDSGPGVHGQSTTGIGVRGLANASGAIPLVAKGASGQTANLQQWQNNSGTALSSINKDGWVGVGTSSPERSIHLQGSNACFRMDRDGDSSAFILVRTSPGFGSIWKTFYVGVDASGVNNGSFFIGDVGTAVSGASAKRLVISNTGRVGINTSSPTHTLHVNGDIRALSYWVGDIHFANGVVATEEGSGLTFKNDAGEKIAVLDRDGNLQVKGKITENPNL